jgi:alpha-tubulin suppressor-like RCC1 family protein
MWGSNPDARLMIERSENVLEPTLTLMSQLKNEDPTMFSVKHLSLGVTHSAVISSSGELFTAGSKLDGQLGGNNDDRDDNNESESDSCSPLTQVLPFGDDDAPKAIAVS